jgi:hypothetical protein
MRSSFHLSTLSPPNHRREQSIGFRLRRKENERILFGGYKFLFGFSAIDTRAGRYSG